MMSDDEGQVMARNLILFIALVACGPVSAQTPTPEQPQQLSDELQKAQKKVDKLGETGARKEDAAKVANKSEAQEREQAEARKQAITLAEKDRLIVVQQSTIADLDAALAAQKAAILELDKAVKRLMDENEAIRKNIKRRSIRRLLPF